MRPDTYTGDDSGCVFGPSALDRRSESHFDDAGTVCWPAPTDCYYHHAIGFGADYSTIAFELRAAR